MDKKYAIFDMDGTLVDSMGYWDELAEEYLHSQGVLSVPPEILQQTAPLPMGETLALFIRVFGLDDTPERARQSLWAIMEEHYRRDIGLKPGAEAYLRELSRRGVAMCVVSATPEPLMELCLTRLGVRGYFQFVLSCESVGAGKDRPDIYHAAAERLGAAAPAEAAVYEDSNVAVRTAKAAGFWTVGVFDAGEADRWDEVRALADETLRRWDGTEP